MFSSTPNPITPLNSKSIEEAFFIEIIAIVNTNNTYSTTRKKYIAGLELAHLAAITQPVSMVTDLLIEACDAIPAFQDTIYAKTCHEEFSGISGLDPYYAQIFSKMSLATGDMQDQLQIFYDYLPNSTITKNRRTYRNTTAVDYTEPLTMGYIGPITMPLTGNNAGFQLYQVDAKTFSTIGVQTYFANVSEPLAWTKPVWQFECDARDTYAEALNGWPKSSPLNATFWDKVTSTMLTDQRYVEVYNLPGTRRSAVTRNSCRSERVEMKVCYVCSGSAALGLQCPYGGGSF